MVDNEEWQPVLFDRDGNPVKFPCESYKGKGKGRDLPVLPSETVSNTPSPVKFDTGALDETTPVSAPMSPVSISFATVEKAVTPNTKPTTRQFVHETARISDNSPTVSHISQSPTFSPGSPKPKPEYLQAPGSPQGRKLSDDFKTNLFRQHVEKLFTDHNDPNYTEDCTELKKHCDDDGWIPMSALVQIKHATYPGHDIMERYFDQSPLFEVKDIYFRLANASQRATWMK